ncbi:MAG: phage terminase small subunit P27 family [Clostridiales bacterium]|nr:phage terminase small subunit P27 family [Clostridiales bacterium]
MGRARKPMEMQKGHVVKINEYQKRKEEASVTTGKRQLRYAPDWLIDDVAKKEWKRLVKALGEIEIIGDLDRNNLAAYCNAFSKYVKVTKELAEAPFLVEKWTKSGCTEVPNPLIGIQKGYADEMRRFAALCGLTIDSRLKAAAVKTAKEEDALEEKFGNI